MDSCCNFVSHRIFISKKIQSNRFDGGEHSAFTIECECPLHHGKLNSYEVVLESLFGHKINRKFYVITTLGVDHSISINFSMDLRFGWLCSIAINIKCFIRAVRE